jgi:hypothetical protein
VTRRTRRASTTDADLNVPAVRATEASGSPLAQRRAGPRSPEEAEARYVASRDEWITAMKTASSGRPADLASLAIAQEAYEAAAAERDRWLSGNRVALPTDEPSQPSLGAVVGQELAWRKVHDAKVERRPGLIGRLAKRLRRG